MHDCHHTLICAETQTKSLTQSSPLHLSIKQITSHGRQPLQQSMEDNNNEVEKHVAVLAFPFGSHAAPLLSLVNAIAATAPFVKFSFFSTTVSNRSTFSNSANQVNNIKPYDVPSGLPEGYVVTENPIEPMELFLKATPGNFRSVMEIAATEAGSKISCVMSDAFFAFPEKMAKEMDVPWVPFWTAGPHSLLVHVDTEVIRHRLGYTGHEDKILDFIPGFSAVGVADLPEGIVSGNLESPFWKMLYDMGFVHPFRFTHVLDFYHLVLYCLA